MRNIFSKEFIESLPKTINSNGCWIPINIKPYNDGYIHIRANNIRYLLHRVAMCIYNNINYYDIKIDTRHNKNCDKRCFFHAHLQPGSKSENIKDSVLHGTHRQAQKEVCPKCGGQYKNKIIKTGWNRGQISRRCLTCDRLKNWKRYH